MAYYLFHCEGGFERAAGPFEVELHDIHEARSEAIQFIGDKLKMWPDNFWRSGDATLTVSDENGLVLFTIHVAAMDAPVLMPSAPRR